MAVFLMYAAAPIAALVVLAYDLFATYNPLTGDPR